MQEQHDDSIMFLEPLLPFPLWQLQFKVTSQCGIASANHEATFCFHQLGAEIVCSLTLSRHTWWCSFPRSIAMAAGTDSRSPVHCQYLTRHTSYMLAADSALVLESVPENSFFHYPCLKCLFQCQKRWYPLSQQHTILVLWVPEYFLHIFIALCGRMISCQ